MRIGTVSSVDSAKRTVRVIYKDKNIVSGWLPVLQHYGAGVHVNPDGEHTHSITGGGTAEADGEHDHEADVTYWMPRINDTVVVLYIPVFNGDGFVLGAI
ncbi:MAG: hypothetical protein K9L62_00470 [Vallitaleaceae bacterium]|nr:hypothetical protein [Vallitaleaceae bacterium]